MIGDERVEQAQQGLTRAFIAVAIPDGIKNQLAGLQSKLKRADADVKWTRPHGIHITLRFMGWLNKDDLEKTKQAVTTVAREFSPFDVEVKGSGTFPERGRPRVVWVGISEGEKGLQQVAARLDQELIKTGLGAADKPFRGHLTLGRVKTGKNLNKLVEYLDKEGAVSFGAFSANSICLFKSELRPEGAIYTVLREEFFRT
jgi:RNA 2',3'-cyclic 3'-phosphodiesterase